MQRANHASYAFELIIITQFVLCKTAACCANAKNSCHLPKTRSPPTEQLKLARVYELHKLDGATQRQRAVVNMQRRRDDDSEVRLAHLKMASRSLLS